MSSTTATTTNPGLTHALHELAAIRGGPVPDAKLLQITGADPFYPTPFQIGTCAAAAQGMIGVAASDLWQLRTGRTQQVAIDVTEAAATLRTVDYTCQQAPDGTLHPLPISPGMQHMLQVTQPWPTRDGRWFLPHLNLPELSQRVLDVLQCENTVAGVSRAVAARDALELEDSIAAARACGGMIRSPEEWLAHPQGQYLATRPVIEIEKVGDAPPQPLPPGTRPLSGIRVLDLTRILAGPVAGRTLAEHGADVLMVTAPHLPQAAEHIRDTSHGKHSTFLDLNHPDQAEQLRTLAATADVFIDGYRPGALAARGFDAETLIAARPGLIHLTVSCFGSGGPLQARAGWEQVAQAVTGVCDRYGAALGRGPTLVFAPMCDYLTGYFGALGVMLALQRRALHGGSYRVHVSLCQSAMFVLRQGELPCTDTGPGRLSEAAAAALSVWSDTSAYGRLRTLGPVLRLSETPPTWSRPTPRLGEDAPQWPGA